MVVVPATVGRVVTGGQVLFDVRIATAGLANVFRARMALVLAAAERFGLLRYVVLNVLA